MYSSNLSQSANPEQQMDTSRFLSESTFSQIKPEDSNKNGFLFGNKRRMPVSAANFLNTSGNVGAPSTDIFASPAPSALPAHVRDTTTSSAKSVHWSPSLVQEEKTGIITASPVPKQSINHISNYSSPSMNGPPLRSLKDEVEPVKKAARRSMNVPVNTSQKLSTSFTNDSPVSNDTASDTWVTVFGFPSEQATNVLKYFSRHGEVVSHQIPRKGNWLHIKYSCTVHARQALSRNGCILDGILRVGVVPCTEKDIIGSEANRTISSANKVSIDQPIREEPEIEQQQQQQHQPQQPQQQAPLFERDQNISNLETSMNMSRFGSISRSGMRSLASSYEVRGGSLRVSQPVKQESIINKIWSAVGF